MTTECDGSIFERLDKNMVQREVTWYPLIGVYVPEVMDPPLINMMGGYLLLSMITCIYIYP